MTGTPWLSRVTFTAADRPFTCSLPSNLGRAERATKKAYDSAPETSSATINNNQRKTRTPVERRDMATVITAGVLMSRFDFSSPLHNSNCLKARLQEGDRKR